VKHQWVDLVIERAAECRRAGILDLVVGDCRVSFAPLVEPASEAMAERLPSECEPSDPLDDPATYGYRDGRAPGFVRGEAGDADG
jgi:hypothetical protein